MIKKNHHNQATCRVVAYDNRRQKYLGAVADLSPDRLVLLTDSPIPADEIMELQLRCDEKRPELDGLCIGARVLWCEPMDGACWAGLQIIPVERGIRQRLARLRAMTSRRTADVTSLSA